MRVKKISVIKNMASTKQSPTASIQYIKSELNTIDSGELKKMLLRLAKHKKENKELLSYLLFEAQDEAGFIQKVKDEISGEFPEINRSNLYLSKKGLRRILRIASKQIRFADSFRAEAEILIHFCTQMKESGIPFHNSQVLLNLYNQQLKKINAAVSKMHEDLQFDFRAALEYIEN